MSHEDDPSKPVPDKEKFKPENVASDDQHGRDEREMKNVPLGSENDRRGAARVRH